MSQPAAAYVLDAFAVVCYLRDEVGAQQVEDALLAGRRGQCRLLLSAVNWAEVLYVTARAHGAEGQERLAALMAATPVEIVPADRELAASAARLKVPGGLSLADCFGAALARETDATMLTGDPEFRRLEPELTIEWLPGAEGGVAS